ncbi:hypothetical protein D8674_028460 [Pyrus ussuriensis x Pyrus communis]|uniref:RNase H type-1 domain-containing protein n=1 Tax=Pyrus ussuriensis x Pyrus communis TaxID=2448454 RepID=A0A5N5HZB9_9ROSA|nr:hypothetical protein D8674_028460 [Pyrus ussuriensis x Pyrus communis]
MLSSTAWILPLLEFCRIALFVLINVDGACNKARLYGAVRVIIRNHWGSLIGGEAFTLQRAFPEAMEAEAAFAGLSLAKELRIRNVIVKSDSKEVVHYITKKSASAMWKIFSIMSEIWRLQLFFNAVSWRWVSRKTNRAAHEAAALAL